MPVVVQNKVPDKDRAVATVWIEVTKPSTAPPSPPPGYDTPVSHAERVALAYNPMTSRFETEVTLKKLGRYEFIFQAEDASGLRSQPVPASLRIGHSVHLPLLMR